MASSKKYHFSTDNLNFLSTLSSQISGIISSALAFAAIDEAKNQDEAILSSIGEGVYAIDKENKYILFNKTAQLISGFDAQEILGSKSGEKLKFFQDDRSNTEGFCPAYIALEENRKVTEKNAILKNKISQEVPISFTANPITGYQNEVIGSLVVFKDITAELEIERMKKELVSIASHELKAPVTAMRGYLEMLIAGDIGEVKGDVKATLKDVLDIDKRLIDLVEDLLDVSHIEQGKINLKLQPINIVEVILQVCKEFGSQIAPKKLKFEFVFDQKKEINVLADAAKLQEVLTNLVSNAIKYTIEGKVILRIAEMTSRVSVEVEDTGIGLNHEEKEHLFEKFYRAKDAKTKDEPGTGLGLYITKKLLEMMDGEIWAKSVKGKGSVFGFSLPKAK